MMLVIIWLLTGVLLVLTLLAAFAIPSWPVLAVVLLALLATVGYRLTHVRAVPIAALAGVLLFYAYDVVALTHVLKVAH